MARKLMLEGLDVLDRRMRELPAENRRRITHALNKGGQELADQVRIIIPVSAPEFAPHMKDTVKAHPIKIGKNGNPYVAVTVGEGETKQAAYRVELGRKPGPPGPHGGHPGMAPHPFFWPSFWKLRARIKRRINRAVRDAAKAVAKYR